MGEGGAYQQDGAAVPATAATFMLTFQAAPAVMAEDSSAGFSVAAKGSLHHALVGGADSEGAALFDLNCRVSAPCFCLWLLVY